MSARPYGISLNEIAANVTIDRIEKKIAMLFEAMGSCPRQVILIDPFEIMNVLGDKASTPIVTKYGMTDIVRSERVVA